MSTIVRVRAWFIFDSETFGAPCGFIRGQYGNLSYISPPIFSQMAGLDVVLPHATVMLNLDMVTLDYIRSAIKGSALPAGVHSYDCVLMSQQAIYNQVERIAADVVRAGPFLCDAEIPPLFKRLSEYFEMADLLRS